MPALLKAKKVAGAEKKNAAAVKAATEKGIVAAPKEAPKVAPA